MQTLLELAVGPNKQIFRNAQPAKRPICQVAVLQLRRRVVGHDNHEIVVAIRTSVAPDNCDFEPVSGRSPASLLLA